MFLAVFSCLADEVQCGDAEECVNKGDQQRSFQCVFLRSYLNKYMLPGLICNQHGDCSNNWDETQYDCCQEGDGGLVECVGVPGQCITFGNQKFV